MSTSYVDEYLLRLGSSVDQSGMQRFYQALREASSLSEHSAKSIAGSFFKAQTEIVGGFSAIGSAAIGMLDKTAMADQSFRLFALDMHLGQKAGMALKITMDALGESLDHLTWDPELRMRSHALMTAQRTMMAGAPSNMEDQLYKIRDIRFQFTMMEVELEYLTRYVVTDFMNALGVGPDVLLDKLERFNAWVQQSLPSISAKITKDFLPIWHDVEDVMKSTGKALEATGLAFTNFVGIFDKSLQGDKFDPEKFAKAIGDIVDTFARWADNIAKVEEGVMHLISALELLVHGHFSEALSQLGDARADATPGSVGAGIVPTAIGGYLSWKILMGILKKLGVGGAKSVVKAGIAGEVAEGAGAGGVVAGAAEGAEAGSIVPGWGTLGGALIGGGLALGGSWLGSTLLSKHSRAHAQDTSLGTNADIPALIDKYAAISGVNSAVVRALFTAESGGVQFDKYGAVVVGRDANGMPSSARGVAQLLQGTASVLGVDRLTTEGNVKGGVELFAAELKRWHDLPTAIAAYHEGDPKMARIMRNQDVLSVGAQQDVIKTLRAVGTHGDVNVGGVTIHIDGHGAEAGKAAGKAAVAEISAMRRKGVQRHIAEYQDLGANA